MPMLLARSSSGSSPGFGFIRRTPLLTASSPLSTFKNGTIPRSFQRNSGTDFLHQAVHSGFEQDSADDPSTGERWRRHDANAKLMHQLQHLRISSRHRPVSRIGAALRAGATALIERRYKPLVTSDLGQHLLSGHNGFPLFVVEATNGFRSRQPNASFEFIQTLYAPSPDEAAATTRYGVTVSGGVRLQEAPPQDGCGESESLAFSWYFLREPGFTTRSFTFGAGNPVLSKILHIAAPGLAKAGNRPLGKGAS